MITFQEWTRPKSVRITNQTDEGMLDCRKVEEVGVLDERLNEILEVDDNGDDE
jgi:hypothetical protein